MGVGMGGMGVERGRADSPLREHRPIDRFHKTNTCTFTFQFIKAKRRRQGVPCTLYVATLRRMPRRTAALAAVAAAAISAGGQWGRWIDSKQLQQRRRLCRALVGLCALIDWWRRVR